MSQADGAMKTGEASKSSAIEAPCALANLSISAGGPVSQRQSVKRVVSNDTSSPYSAFSRSTSTSSCSAPTTPTMAGEPSAGMKSWTTPSSAIWPSASRSFFCFIESPIFTRRRISGAKLGTPRKTRSSPSVSVSPMRSRPWLGMPTTSPGHASSASWRSCAKKNCGEFSATILPVRTSLAFMPRDSLPEHTRMKAMRSRWLRSMFAWILKTKPVIFASCASTVREAASSPCGGGAKSASASMRSRMPKLRSAEPKKTGVRWPSRNALRSNVFRPSVASSICSTVSRKSAGFIRPSM